MVAVRSRLGAYFVSVVAVTIAGLGACTFGPHEVSTSAGVGCVENEPRRSLDRDVSFRNDVLPIFRMSCSALSCHGSLATNGVFLGPPDTTGNPAVIHTKLLLGISNKSSLPFVAPGKPGQSWLLRKIDGDYCGLQCMGGCGDRMPLHSAPLEPLARNIIATWIERGAENN